MEVTGVCERRAERRAAIGQSPMAFARHGQSAGTVQVRAQLAQPARIPVVYEVDHFVAHGDRPAYPSAEGWSWR